MLAAALMPAPAVCALELRVVDTDGEPVAGARVTVVGRSGMTVADRQGLCRLDRVPEPPFVLFIARADGVALKPVTVTELPAETPLEVVVQPTGETVTVVSGYVPDLEVPPAAAATVLGRADLSQRNPVRLSQALENIPGASNSGEGHPTVPGLRGLPKHRTLIILDDGRVAAERRAGPSATFLDPATVDEIEVIRGPGSVAYGSDAFGGVIRARSRIPAPGEPLSVRYGILLGSVADQLAANAEFGTSVAGGGLLVGAHYRDFGDYDSPEGVVPVSAATGCGFRLAFQRPIGSGVLRFGWRSDLERDVGKPAPDFERIRRVYPEEDSHRFNVGFERPGPGDWTRLGVTLAWDSYRLVLEKERPATATEPRSIVRADVDANDYEIRFEAERPLGSVRLVIGANAYGRYGLHAVDTAIVFDADDNPADTGVVVGVDRARRDDVGVFAGAGRDFGRWGLSAGVRADRVSSKNRGGHFGDRDATNSGFSGFLSLYYDLTDRLQLTGQVAQGFRDAVLSDRYYRGITGRGFITGNPDLEPETSLQYDLAIRYRTNGFDLAGYAYLYRIDDVIERVGVGDDFFFRNGGLAEITGVELEAGVVLSRRLSLRAGAQYLRGEAGPDDLPTDDVPPAGAFLMLRGEPNHRWWWMVRAAAFAEDDRPGPTERVAPAYELLDAGVTYRLNDAVQLQLLGRNLLDSSYLGSADEDAVLAPGRSLQLSITGRF